MKADFYQRTLKSTIRRGRIKTVWEDATGMTLIVVCMEIVIMVMGTMMMPSGTVPSA
jgi:hypothetical protein